jgi:hypothetical protein
MKHETFLITIVCVAPPGPQQIRGADQPIGLSQWSNRTYDNVWTDVDGKHWKEWFVGASHTFRSILAK